MKADFANAFIEATKNVFATMLHCEAHRTGGLSLCGAQSAHEVAGYIGLSGATHAGMAISMPRTTAVKVAESMLQESIAEFNQDVIDAVGEVANMVAGAAKAMLEHHQLSITLPTVVVGQSRRLDFPSSSTPFCISFDTEFGPVAVEIGIMEG